MKTNVAAVALFFVLFLAGTCLSQIVLKAKAVALGKVYWDVILAVGMVAVGVMAHEGLHGLCAMLFGKAKKEDLKIGFSRKRGLFYCHCKKDVSVGAYRVMLIVPIVVTGIIPFVVCLFVGGLPLSAAFAMLTAGGMGDLAMLWNTRKETKNAMIRDHEDRMAFYAVYKEGEEPEGFTETTEEEEQKTLSAVDKKGAESMGVKIVLIALFLALTALALYVLALVLKFV